MFRNAYQSGLLSIFYSCGPKPLELWDTEVKNGHIKRLTDKEVRSIVLEIGGSNVSTTYITCPKGGKTLGITLPYMVMIVKNLKKHFTFQVTVVDHTGARRRFRISNFQNTTQILPLCTTMPINLNDGWNQIQFNLAEFTKRSYKTEFMEVAILKINANIRLRRVYFTEELLPDDQLPPEYRLYLPLTSSKVIKTKVKVEELNVKENVTLSSNLKAIKTEGKGSKVDVVKGGSKVSVHTKNISEDQQPKTIVKEENELEAKVKHEKLEAEDVTVSEGLQESEEPTPTKPVTDVEQAVLEGEKPIEPVPEGEANEKQPVLEEDKPIEPIPQEEATTPIDPVPDETATVEPAAVAETVVPTDEQATAIETAE